MFLVFVDLESKDPKVVRESYDAINQLVPVQEKYGHVYGFFYVTPVWADKRRALGIYHDKVPAMAFNMLDTTMKVPYPKDLPIETHTILDWFEQTITSSESKFRNNKGKIIDGEIKGMLNET